MIAFVVVSHSAPLANAVVDLAAEMARPVAPVMAVAAGTADGGFGTDAARIAEVIGRVCSPDGVLVFTDLGSAVLSAELALELVDDLPGPVRLSTAPLVEGLVAAVARAAAGGTLDEVSAEADRAGGAKIPPADTAEALHTSTPGLERTLLLTNSIGLHARPAAAVVGALKGLDARVLIGTDSRAPVDGRSLVGLMSLGATKGDRLRVQADGPDAGVALDALEALVSDHFGEQ